MIYRNDFYLERRDLFIRFPPGPSHFGVSENTKMGSFFETFDLPGDALCSGHFFDGYGRQDDCSCGTLLMNVQWLFLVPLKGGR